MSEIEKIKVKLPKSFPSDINILIGENGSGKSIALNQLAQKYVGEDNNVIAIANCIFDKFTFKSKFFHFMGAREGSRIIENTITNILDEIHTNKKRNNLDNQFIIRESFLKIGYEPTIGFSIEIWDGRRRLLEDEEEAYLYHIFDGYGKKMLFEQYINETSNFRKKYLYNIHENIFWFDFDSRSNYHNSMFINYEIFTLLKKVKNIKINLYLKKIISKTVKAIPIYEASSGQLHLLINFLFISSKIDKSKKETVILIDEPESSLHPKWQSNYLKDISDFFYRYNIKIIVATHSPIIISALNSLQYDLKDNISSAIYQVKNYEACLIKEDEDQSIEAIFWEVFGVITPKNSFLARHIVHLIHEINKGKLTHQLAISELKKIEKISFDNKQKIVIKKAINIIENEI